MATLLKCGGLFLHVPKTGGNWVSDVLEAEDLVFAHIGGKHAGGPQLAPLLRLLRTPQRYDRANRPLFAFCFLRHPLRWYESWYRMNAALDWPTWASDEDAWNPSVELNGLGAPTFAGFVRNVLDRRPGFVTRMYAHYADHAHYVGRQEHMAEDLIEVLTFLKVSFDPERLRRHARVNVSERADVRLDDSLRRELEESEHEAFARYGYASECSAPGTPRFFPPHGTRGALTGPFVHDEGAAWRVALPQLARFADDEQQPQRSMLTLMEDGRPLAVSHAVHDDVRRAGGGRFSHWNEMLLFSASDNTDPNRNGRRYEIGWTFPAPGNSTALRQ